MMREMPLSTWRYVRNTRATLGYRRHGPFVEGHAADVLRDWNENGIAKTTIDQLSPGESHLFDRLVDKVSEIESERQSEIDSARQKVGEGAYKSFILNVLGDRPVLTLDDPAVALMLSPSILGIVNGYMGMVTQLRFLNVWHTLVSKGEARESQLWHRDPEDRLIAKVFIYLSVVDEGAGPLTYAPNTHPKGTIRKDAPIIDDPTKGRRRSSDEQIATVVDPAQWVTATGRKGTIVFADTRGYHRGGLARTRERLMLTAMFTSPSAKTKEYFDRRVPAQLQSLDEAQRLAFAF